MTFDRFEQLLLQDVSLAVVGLILLFITLLNILGVNGFLTLLVGCGLMGYAVLDMLRQMAKVQK